MLRHLIIWHTEILSKIMTHATSNIIELLNGSKTCASFHYIILHSVCVVFVCTYKYMSVTYIHIDNVVDPDEALFMYFHYYVV